MFEGENFFIITKSCKRSEKQGHMKSFKRRKLPVKQKKTCIKILSNILVSFLLKKIRRSGKRGNLFLFFKIFFCAPNTK